MRCEEIQKELSAASGRFTAPELARHVESCPRCSDWAAACRRLDHAWRLTRPAASAASGFEKAWVKALAAHHAGAGRPALVRRAFLPATSWTRLAAAAAVLALAFIGAYQMNRSRVAGLGAGAIAAAPLPTAEAESGETLFIHISGGVMTTQTRPVAENSENDNVAIEHDLFNFMESLSTL